MPSKASMVPSNEGMVPQRAKKRLDRARDYLGKCCLRAFIHTLRVLIAAVQFVG